VPALAMWKGDEVAACVAAASIVAKVTRDRIMTALAEHYPAYGFAQHKGYSTRSHMRALTQHGPCPEHRASFANVMELASRGGEPPDGWQEDIPAEDGLTAIPEQIAAAEQMRSGELLDGELTYG
jgi:hypothetical protein